MKTRNCLWRCHNEHQKPLLHEQKLRWARSHSRRMWC